MKQARVGVLSGSSPRSASFYRAFEQRLRELGWIEGNNLTVEFRAAAADERQFAPLAAELAGLRCDVIVAGGPEALVAALKVAASPIPIVAVALNYDPVRRGYAATLARPGGNITGVSLLATDVEAKRLDLLHEALPGARKLAVLWDEHNFDQRRSAEDAARKLKLELVIIENRPRTTTMRFSRGRARPAPRESWRSDHRAQTVTASSSRPRPSSTACL